MDVGACKLLCWTVVLVGCGTDNTLESELLVTLVEDWLGRSEDGANSGEDAAIWELALLTTSCCTMRLRADIDPRSVLWFPEI